MTTEENTTFGVLSMPTIIYETEHIGGTTYMVTKTTIERFNVKITK